MTSNKWHLYQCVFNILFHMVFDMQIKISWCFMPMLKTSPVILFSLRTCLQDNYNCGTWTASASGVWRACLRIIDSWNGAVKHIAQYIVSEQSYWDFNNFIYSHAFFLYVVSCLIVLPLREDPKEAYCDHNPSCCICSANFFFFFLQFNKKEKTPNAKVKEV